MEMQVLGTVLQLVTQVQHTAATTVSQPGLSTVMTTKWLAEGPGLQLLL
jgi:hypothetical protein